MKTFLFALILATMTATLCMVGMELASAEGSALFIKFYRSPDPRKWSPANDNQNHQPSTT